MADPERCEQSTVERSRMNVFEQYAPEAANSLQTTLIKFPFKRNGLPCCEDEPGSEIIALK